MHNLSNNMSWKAQFASFMNTPNYVKPLANCLFLTPLCDKCLHNTELCFVSWLVTFRVMDDDVFVVRRRDSCVDVGCTSFKMSDILNADELLNGDRRDRGHTAIETLNIALISADLPVPLYEKVHEPNVQAEW